MSPLNKKQTILLIFLVFLLAALPISIYLVQTRQIFKPKAATITSPNTSYTMNVLVVKYFPLTADGQNIDIKYTGDVGNPIGVIRAKVDTITTNLVKALEKSTTYLGYRNLSAQPSLKYQVVGNIEHDEPAPFNPTTRAALYNQMMTRENICNYVDNQGVKEVWLFAYQGPVYPGSNPPVSYLGIWESKMSPKAGQNSFGDVSNSGRFNDMPRCSHTYRVYTFNYGDCCGTANALHSWSHQLEAEMNAVDNHLFWDLFVGPSHAGADHVTGRCGWTHDPPNAQSDYDYKNSVPNKSDCLDWNPDGLGVLSDISCQTWNGCQDTADDFNNPQMNYLVWLWQNLPGMNNQKTYQGAQLRNFWDVHGDFDQVMLTDKTLKLTGNFTADNPQVVIQPPVIQPQASTPPFVGQISSCVATQGDANADGRANGLDFSVWSSEFLSNIVSKADFNCDGAVNGLDFSIWSSAFLNS